MIRLGVVAGVLLILSLVGGDAYAVSFVDNLPNVHGLDAANFQGDTIIQDRNGVQLADIAQEGDRRITVTLDQISPKLIEGTISIEDHTFWTNPGFDSSAILRTALTNFRSGGIAGGASTITQQVAKQLFLSPQQTFKRKIEEIALAYELTQTYSKQQILELYLNRSPYGAQQYGVEAAAETYFHTSAKNVDLAEAAMLAGLPQDPTFYNPVIHLDAAKARQKDVLDAMARYGYITSKDDAAAYAEHLTVYPPQSSSRAPQFVGYVEQELSALGYKPGLQQLVVKTTLDLGKQQLADQVLASNLAANVYKDRTGRLASSMVSIDPRTGQILAYSVSGSEYDFVGDRNTPINPGSSVKPFTYGVALLDRKLTMDSTIYDGPDKYVMHLDRGETYTVSNFDMKSHGNQPAKVALANSLNIPAVKVEASVGVPQVVDFYRQMGMNPVATVNGKRTTTAPDSTYGPSLTLGGYPITLLDEDTALATYADMGMYHQPESILQITDKKGQVLYTANPNLHARQAVDPGVAYIIGAILSDDANRKLIFGEGTPLHLTDRQAAAKTGTTENYKDALTIGFTPDLATAVWVGDILDSTHTLTGNQADGVFVAAPAWHRYMEQALQGVPNHWYSMPADIVKQGNSYFLSDATKIPNLVGDMPAPSPSASPGDGIPADPGTGPQRLDNKLCQQQQRVPFPIPGCPPTPAPGG